MICLADFDVRSAASAPKKFALEVPKRVFKFEALTAQEATEWSNVLEDLRRVGALVLEKDSDTAQLDDVQHRQRKNTNLAAAASNSNLAVVTPVSPAIAARGFADVTEGAGTGTSAQPSSSAHSLGLDSALRAAEALVTPPPSASPPKPRSSLRVDQISSSESRYFQRFGLLPPVEPSGEMQSPVRSNDDNNSGTSPAPTEKTSLLGKPRKVSGATKTPKEGDEGSCCSCCTIC